MIKRTPSILFSLVLLWLVAAALGAQKLPEYDVVVLDSLATEVGDLGNVNALEINDRGQARGQAHGRIPGRIAGAAVRYTPGVGLENLDPFGNFNSATWQLNNSGLTYGSDFGDSGQTAIYLYDDSGFEFIAEDQSAPFLSSFFANAINDKGEIVGVTGVWSNAPAQPWRYTPGAGWQDLSSVDARLRSRSSAELINNRGDIVLTSEPADHDSQLVFLLTGQGEFLELGDLGGDYKTMVPLDMNESDQVVGYASDGFRFERGFLFTPGQGLIAIHRDGFRSTQAMHVTPDGVVAGILKKKRAFTYDSLFVKQPGEAPRVVVRRSRFRRFAARSGFKFRGMDAQAINDRLEFVGSVFQNTNSGLVAPYLYSSATGLVNLREVVEAATVGWTATEAWDINNLGQILVSVTDGNRRSTAILTPVEKLQR